MSGRLQWLALILIVMATASSCSRAGGEQKQTVILISAAASLKNSLETIAQVYEREHSRIDVQFNFGSSGTLQKQIEQGAPADLFLSAGKKQMDPLKAKKLISASKDVLANRLVIIVKSDYAGATADADSLLNSDIRKLAVGEPDTVPAGIYAKQALESLGLWDKLASKLVYGQDVRQVLTFVESGNADAGIVYRTDQLASGKVKKAFEIPSASHDPIVYPFAVLSASKHPEEANSFYEYLSSQSALDIFKKQGFLQP